MSHGAAGSKMRDTGSPGVTSEERATIFDTGLPDYLEQQRLSQLAAYDLGVSDGRSGHPSLSYMHSGLSTMYLRGYAFGGCLRYAANNGLWDAWVLLAAQWPMRRTTVPRTV